ncbi:filamentous hemagglutinin N-terminal domain-containing protein [Tychonema sp. LEGE 07203]|uniref:two-partner secretion domain-containing protein n=1 Tax=Tychonema sp. LEGE 07203 TaxID=1828671 RepID=UPI00187FF67B|nr:filamentous hemagglutinin N-terminal domain-containing protein [Tychonema sp. LEGE 07203]MBE9094152.1 filamentous hemagglutinin N-terminal domain-containing protein [Tychonema sp. LEGE 07203]
MSNGFYIAGASYLLLLSFYLCLFPDRAIGQIVPDGTLGPESSRAVSDTINNLPSDRITGGATRGSSLFHSFGEFNIKEGRGAYFANPSGIANIFTRVTGGKSSNILGTLGVLGNANLFLINPKGIVFGPNARLDLRGSFVGSTADSVVFDNGFEFSSTNPQTSPLLTVNIPVGLRFRDNPGTIVNQSTATGKSNLPASPVPIPITNRVGLAVEPGQTLALIGGDIQIPGGNLTANGGQILLGSAASPGLVNLALTSGPQQGSLSLNYDNIQNFGNIQISDGTLINTSGTGGGRVELKGGNVTLDGARFYAITLGNIDGRGIDIDAQKLRSQNGTQFSTLTLGDGAGGNINFRAADSIEMSGLGVDAFQQVAITYLVSGTTDPFDPLFTLFNGSAGAGAGGSITFDTGRLLLNNGVLGSGITFGGGRGGNLIVRANTFEMVGSGINNGTAKESTGAGGGITVDVSRLIMRDGSLLGTTSYSSGPSGSINVKAAESVELFNSGPRTVVSTGISTLSIGSTGRAGNINIDTKRLSLSDGSAFTLGTGVLVGRFLFSQDGGPAGNLTVRATESVEISGISQVLTSGIQNASALTSATLSSSRGGDIRVDTPSLIVRDGGIVSTSSLGAGDVGNITVNADRIQVSGSGNNGLFVSTIDASVGKTFGSNPDATANAGSLNLTARDRLTVAKGATITVQATGTGRAGNINVVANSIGLDNKARIDGTTVSGTGANINLQSQDIQLRRGSRITTDAGNSDGGNININSGILVALPQENSDITANARTAAGGRVSVNVPSVFGFSAVTREQVRSRLNLDDAQFADLQVSPTSLLGSSDIAAISQSGGPALQGAVTFGASGVNPAQGLVELPQNVVDPAALIAANPCIEGGENEFTVTGKGGVPASPNDVLSSEPAPFPWVEGGTSAADSGTDLRDVTDRSSREETEKKPAGEVVPARGWVVNAKGEVTLVGYNPGNGADSRNPRSNSGCTPRLK